MQACKLNPTRTSDPPGALRPLSHPGAARTLLLWLLLALVACSCGTRTSRPAVEATTELWFQDLKAPLALEADDAAALIAHAGETNPEVVPSNLDTARAPLSARLRADSAPRIVFLSASHGRGPAAVAMGVGAGVTAAVAAAASQLRNQRGYAPRPIWLALDVVTEVGRQQVAFPGESLDMVRGLDGLAFVVGSNLAFPAQELLGRRLVSRDLELRTQRLSDAARGRADSRPWAQLVGANQDVRLRTFRTRSFFVAGDRTHERYRGHALERAVDDASLRAAIDEGARYLRDAVDAEGRFRYAYLAKQAEVKDKYNMVRHAGTAYAMLETYELSGDRSLLAAAERSLTHLVGHIHPHGDPSANVLALAYKGKIKMGGVALAALALATHARITGDKRYLKTAQGLCRYMVGNQRVDGSFVHQRAHPGGDELPFVSQYYPGEALLGLLNVYRLDADPAWLDAAEAGADFLIKIRDRGIVTARLTHDHWLLYALERLHAERPHAHYLEHAMRIAQAIVGAQQRTAVAADHIGGYARVEPRATPIATRNEGLMAAYRLALKNGRDSFAETILAAVELGNEVMTSMRIDPGRALYIDAPQRALGGVTRSHQNFEIRIDYVQHSISAWIALLRARQSRRAGAVEKGAANAPEKGAANGSPPGAPE